MQKSKIGWAVLGLFGLNACETVPLLKPATTPIVQEAQRSVNHWIGRPTNRLVVQWGQPNNSYVDEVGKKYIVYEVDAETRTRTKPQCSPEYKGQDGYYRDKSRCPEGAATKTSYVVSCIYTFEIYNRTVVAGSQSGDKCDVPK